MDEKSNENEATTGVTNFSVYFKIQYHYLIVCQCDVLK